MAALDTYRAGFEGSEQMGESYAAAGVNVFTAESGREARQLFSSAQQHFANQVRDQAGKLQPPIDEIDEY